MIEIYCGTAEERQQAERADDRRTMLLRTGRGVKTIYLNGGSETRRAQVDYWREFACECGIGFRKIGGCILLVGGSACAPVQNPQQPA
jgi:hypothetical protein